MAVKLNTAEYFKKNTKIHMERRETFVLPYTIKRFGTNVSNY